MRQSWGFRVMLVVAGSVLAVRAAPAQDPTSGAGPVPASPYAVAPGPEWGVAPEPAEAPAPHRGPVKKCLSKCKDCLNKYGLCCWSHHNSLGCSSFEAEYRFIFGSCRTFYGEPCERRPPHSQTPGAPGAPSGYGPASGGCACP